MPQPITSLSPRLPKRFALSLPRASEALHVAARALHRANLTSGTQCRDE